MFTTKNCTNRIMWPVRTGLVHHNSVYLFTNHEVYTFAFAAYRHLDHPYPLTVTSIEKFIFASKPVPTIGPNGTNSSAGQPTGSEQQNLNGETTTASKSRVHS